MFVRVGCFLFLAIAGCRGDLDQKIDALIAGGMSVKLNSAGDVFWIDTAGSTPDEHFWKCLSDFEHLSQLNLTGSPVTDADVARLTSLPALQSLDLSYTKITPAGLHVLSHAEHLQTLSLNGVRLSHAAVEPLSQLTRLRSLSLMESDLAAEDLAKIQAALPGCLIVE